jgi:hypothetical protein
VYVTVVINNDRVVGAKINNNVLMTDLETENLGVM